MSARKTPPSSLWIALALAVVTLAVFCPVTSFQFVRLDDPDFISLNPLVQAGLTSGGWKWAWHSEVVGNWHPVTVLSLMLDCQLCGVKPWWPHLVNVLLHAANTVLLFGLLQRMTGALWRSAVVAALFALHPLHVESVAWVSERKDVLSTLFWFLTIWAYVRCAEKWRVASGQRPVFYGLSLLFFALGLMSKPMLVTVPFALLLLDYWPLGRMKAGASLWRLAVEKIPFFAMSAALCVVTFGVQKRSGGMVSLQDFPLVSRLGNALVSYVRYIEMMFWPRHLAGFYPRLGQWPWWEVMLAALLLLSVSGLVLAQARRRPYLAAGWFWYLGTLAPVIGLVQAGIQSMADRYTYIPLIGLFIMLAWGGWELACAWGLARFAPTATAAALAACAALTAHQEFYWKDTETLYKRMLEVTPNNCATHNNLGSYYLEVNRTNEALSNYLEAIREKPDFAEAHNNLGFFYLKEERTNEAISNLTAAIQEKPNFAEAHNNLGSVFLRQKHYDEAVEQFRTAVRLHPDFLSYVNLANALAGAASTRDDASASAEAARSFEQALQLNPDPMDAHYDPGPAWQALGFLYVSQRNMPEAERAFRELIRLQPNDSGAYRCLGNVLAAQNKPADAISFYVAALRLNPADYGTEYNLALTLSRQGKREEAAEHYRQALRINPSFAEAQTALRELQKVR